MENKDMPAQPCSIMDPELAQALKDGREYNGLSMQEIRKLSSYGGLTKREELATRAMQGILSNSGIIDKLLERDDGTPGWVADNAYMYADAVLRKENTND